MINKGINTKTWNDASVERFTKPDGVNRVSANDQEKALKGKEDLSELLNQISDPNWVDPKKNKRVGNSELGKDAFLKLMLTQLKNQDPTNPLNSHEMAAQLAQFSSLEQLYNINENLGALKKDQDPMINFQALSFIGKTIASDSSKVIRSKGDKSHELRFSLTDDAKNVKLTIKDSSGTAIKTVELQDLKKGENKFTWNGGDNKGITQNAGNYTFDVTAETNGTKVAVKTSVNGKVTGVNFASDGPVLMVGDQSIRLADVKKIEDGDAKEQLKNLEKSKEVSGKEVKAEEKKETVTNDGAAEAPAEQARLGNIEMSPELMAQVLKPAGINK